MKDVVQKSVEAGVETLFDMRLQRSKFLVKNFTDGNIQVKLGENEAHSVIAPKSWEVVFNNIDNVGGATIPCVTDNIIVTAESDGLVEVASVD